MTLKSSLNKIKKFLIKRYSNNLDAFLVFGSANTGPFLEGKSDIDIIILLKRKNKINLEKENLFLFKKFKKEKLKIVHLKTIKDYEKHIYKKGSWASWITVINGSKKILSSKEFEDFRKRLILKPIPRKKLIEYLKHKDKFELKGYFKKRKGFILTKAYFSHLRRKIQIINYFQNGKIIFDYEKCLKNIRLEKEEKEKLKKLHEIYKKRMRMSKKQILYYNKLAEKFTNKILKIYPK